MKPILLLWLLAAGLAQAQIQQPTGPVIESNNPLLATTLTPEGVLGERRISVTFTRRFVVQGTSIQPLTVHLYYSLSETGSIRENLDPNQARSRPDLGVTPAQLVDGRWQLILPHSGNRNGALGTTVLEARGGQKVFYRWHVSFENDRRENTAVSSFTMPRPLNIAVIGDSYGSGEGAPTPGNLWAFAGCHRSVNAGEYRAVQQFVSANPQVAIVYEPFFVSCSGAQTRHVVGRDYRPGFCDQLGVTQTNTEVPQLRQLQQVFENAGRYKGDIQGKIDAVVISIGGNDAGFAKAVEEAFFGSLTANINFYNQNATTIIPASYDELRRFFDNQCIRYVFTTEYPDPTQNEAGQVCGLPQNVLLFTIFSLIESTIQDEQNAAEALCQAGEGLVEFFAGDNNRDDCSASGLFESPHYDYLLNYIRCNVANSGVNGMASAESIANGFIGLIRAIQASNGSYQAFFNSMNQCMPADGVPSNATVFATLIATQEDIRAAKNGFLLPMNSILSTKVNQFRGSGFPNWHYVGGAMNASRLNGICSCDANGRYFNSILASFDQQGNMQGTMHMNTRGQTSVYQPLVLNKLREVITYDARKAMFAEACLRMPELPALSPGYESLLRTADARQEEHNKAIQRAFEKLYLRVKPVADIIVKELDPKAYASHYANRSFEKMRAARLGR